MRPINDSDGLLRFLGILRLCDVVIGTYLRPKHTKLPEVVRELEANDNVSHLRNWYEK